MLLYIYKKRKFNNALYFNAFLVVWRKLQNTDYVFKLPYLYTMYEHWKFRYWGQKRTNGTKRRWIGIYIYITADPIKIKFGTVNYVGKMTAHAKFHVNPFKRGFPANGWNIRKNFCSHIPFFRNSFTGQTLPRIFVCNGSNDAVSRKDVPFGGWKIWN